MTLEQLKINILNRDVSSDPIIFKISDNTFIANTYINAISEIQGKDIMYVDSLSELTDHNDDIFSSDDDVDNLRVIHIDKIDCENDIFNKLIEQKNIIVVAKDISNSIDISGCENVIEIPKLEPWQLQDYIVALAPGLDTNQINMLFNLCGKNIYRLDNELSKLKLFAKTEQKYLFDQMIQDKSFSDLSTYTVFNITNAIIYKDTSALATILKEIKNIDVSEFGLITILYQNFRNIINMQLGISPTPESTGLTAKQFYAIKNIPRIYSKEQLVHIHEFICSLDERIKSGDLDVKYLIDYTIVKILAMD